MGGVQTTQNGKPTDLADAKTQVTGGPPQGELGSAYGGTELLFSRWEDGKVFSIDPVTEEQFENMLRRDGKTRQLEQVLTLPLLSAEWYLEPDKDDSGETEFVKEALTRPANAGGMTTPFELVIGQMTSAIVFRRAYFEKVFDVLDGRVVYRKLAFRPASTCWLLRDNANFSFQGFKQRFMRANDYTEKVIEPAKAFVYIHDQRHNQLVGASALETAYSIFDAKQKVRFLWYSFLENQTIPKAIAKAANSDSGQQQALAKKVASLKGGGVVGIGPDENVSAFESANNAGDVFHQALAYLDGEMVGSVLAGFLELTSSAAQRGRGSYALSRDASELFLRSRQATLTEMSEAITSWLIADLVRWNFGINGRSPRFCFKPLEVQAGSEALTLYNNLANAQSIDPRVPGEFLDELTLKVASELDLDVDVVRKAIQGRSEANPTQKLTQGISAAASLVQQAGLGQPDTAASVPAPAQ
jgi:hypothetical protein